MGDCQNGELRVDFDGRLKLRFMGSQVTTDAGLLAYRELDEALALTETGADNLQDCRLGQNKQHGLVPLLRQSIYSRLAGYEDVNDAERLCVDPAMRHVVGGRATRPGKFAASTSEVGRFETQIISTPSNLTSLIDLSGRWIDKVHQRMPLKELILDMDSSVSETYGDQQGSTYNGHFECTCYHPLFLFNQFGDLERAMLRRGHHHSAKFWRRVLLPVIDRYRSRQDPQVLSGRRGLCQSGVVQTPGERRTISTPSASRPTTCSNGKSPTCSRRPVGRPPRKPIVLFAGFLYRAASWDLHRRVVAKVEWHHDELFPRVGFVVTNIWKPPADVIHFYNGRGTAEQWIKEGKYALKWTKLSCRTFRGNQTRLQLFALAYNLANFLRRLALPKPVRHWSLTTLREKLIKIGAKIVRHARYVTFQMAEVAIPRQLFREILQNIARLRTRRPALKPG